MNKRFNLVRYFAISSLVIFSLVGLAVLFMEHQQGSFLRGVQSSKYDTFRRIQGDFTSRAEQVAIRDMLRINENGHENLAKVMSNVLWERDLGPYMAKVQSLTVPGCKALSGAEIRKACFQDFGRKLQALPGFQALDQKVFAVMRHSTVFKVKMYDLRGVTLYSSEHAQVGEDKSENAGWKKAALDNHVVSELTHRDKFSAFESVVVDRDLISSYLPMVQPGSNKVVGVFEIYSDVTPFIRQIRSTTGDFRFAANKNSESLNAQDSKDAEELLRSGWAQLALVSFLLIVLYVLLLRVIMRAQRLIDLQQSAADEHKRQQAKADKANTMTQLVEGLINQLKVPLSGIKTSLSEVRNAMQNAKTPEDSWQASVSKPIAACELAAQQAMDLVNGLRTLGHKGKGTIAEVDVSALVAGVVQVVRVVTPARVQIVEDYRATPRIECDEAQLSQALLNVLLNGAQSIDGSGRVKVVTGVEGGEIRITIKDSGTGIPTDMLPMIFEPYFTTKDVSHDGSVNGLGLSIAKDIVEQHGGRILVHSVPGKGSAFAICLPLRTKTKPKS